MRSEGGENVAQIDCVLGVSVEVRPISKSCRRNAVDHRSITQNGQIEAVTIERHELRFQLGDLVTECTDQLLLRPITNVGSTLF